MLDIVFAPVRVEKSSALHHVLKERCSRQRCKNQELYRVYPMACCKISSAPDGPDIVSVRPHDEHPVDMNTMISDCPDAGNNILQPLLFIICFKCRGIDGFKADVQSMAA